MKTKQLMALLGAGLFISLALNIFTAGTVIGSSVSSGPKATDAVAQDRQLRDGLSDADKLVLKQAMDANRRKITRLHDDIESMKQDLRGIIKQDTLDEKALDAVLEKRKNSELALLQLVHDTRKAAMEKMSPQGQAILAKVGHLGFDLSPQCR